MHYRAEIDGLRAIAVVPVILYHAGLEFFNGGFVGVDIFFVISGYLITSIILKEIDEGTFSLINFYARRARRILPALLVMVLVCIPISWVWLMPNDIGVFAESIVAVSTFSSNIYFGQHTGYFDNVAELKPLLHTWSLAVEEQYYILFPLLLLLIWKLGKRWVLATLGTIFLISLGYAHWSAYNNSTATFYLLSSRVWELLMGVFVAFYLNYRSTKNVAHNIKESICIIGLSLIIYSVVVFDNNTPFPSLITLVPTIGTALIILYAEKGTMVNYLLRNKVIVGIGLISYSAYLWHQPIFAFAKYRSPFQPDMVLLSLLGILTISVAYLSWRFVELPIRRIGTKQNPRTLLFTLFSIIIFAGMGIILHSAAVERGFMGRWAGEGTQWIENPKNEEVHFILAGDSHARQYFESFREKLGNGVLVSKPCLWIGNNHAVEPRHASAYKCDGIEDLFIDFVSKYPNAPIIITFYWTSRIGNFTRKLTKSARNKLNDNEIEQAINNYLENFSKRIQPLNNQLIFIGNVPSASKAGRYMRSGYERCLYYYQPTCPTKYPKNKAKGIDINRTLFNFSVNHSNIEFYNPHSVLCGEVDCYIFKNGELLYADHAHLTRSGTDIVVENLVKNYGL